MATDYFPPLPPDLEGSAAGSAQGSADLRVVTLLGRFGLTWREGTVARKLTSNVTYFHPDFAVTHVERVPLLATIDLPGGLPGRFSPGMFVTNDMCPPDDLSPVLGPSSDSAYTSRLELRGDAPFLRVTVTANPGGALAPSVVSTHATKATDVAGRLESWAWAGHTPPEILDYVGVARQGDWFQVPMEGSAPTQHVATYQANRSFQVPGKSSYTLQKTSSASMDEQSRVDPASGLRVSQWPEFQFGRRLQDSSRIVTGSWLRRLWHASHPAGTYFPGDSTWATLNWVQATETLYEWSDGVRYPVERPWVRYVYDASVPGFLEVVAYVRTGTTAPIFYARTVSYAGDHRVPTTTLDGGVAAFEGFPTFGVLHGLGFVQPEGASIWRSALGQPMGDRISVTEQTDTYQWGVLNGVGYAGVRDSLAICPIGIPADPHVSLVPGDHRAGINLQEAGLQAYQFDPDWPLRGVPDAAGRLPETAVPMITVPSPGAYEAVYTVSGDGIWARWFQYAGTARSGYFEAEGDGLLPAKLPWVWACSLVPNELLVLAWDLEGVLGWTLLAVTLPPPPAGLVAPPVTPPVTDLLSERADEDEEERVTEVSLSRVLGSRSRGSA